MLIVTAQRPGEVFRMRWQDIGKAGWWTIPSQYTKNSEPHRVPLTKRALTLIDEATKASPGNNPWVFAGTQGANVAARAKKAAAALRRDGGIAFDFHRHDLRRTAATGMAQAGTARPTISHVLNHVDGGARATLVYDRYSYDDEKRAALEAWGRRLDAILG
jgi:integrase